MCVNIVVYVSPTQGYINIFQMKFILLQWKTKETYSDRVMPAFDSLFLGQMNDIRWMISYVHFSWTCQCCV